VVTLCDQLPVFEFVRRDGVRRDGVGRDEARREGRRRWRASSFAVVGVMCKYKG